MIQIYNRIIPTRSEETLVFMTVIVVLVIATMSAVDAIRNLIFISISKSFRHHSTEKIFENYFRLSGGSPRQQDGHRNPLDDVEVISTFLSRSYIVHFFDILWFPMFLIALAFLHPLFTVLGLIGAVWLGSLAIWTHIIVSAPRPAGHAPDRDGLIRTENAIANSDVIVSLGMIGNVVRRWSQGYRALSEERNHHGERLAMIAAAGKASRLLIQTLALGLGGYLAINDAVSAGAIIASSVLIGRALTPVEGIITAWSRLIDADRAYHRLLHLIEADPTDDQELDLRTGSPGLSVDRLAFVDGRKVVFRNVSFDAQPGTMVAIAGPSGAGKSLLARHLVGLERGSEGMVQLDGLDMALMNSELRLQSVGYMPQADMELTGTVVDHIGRFGAFSAEDVLQAACLADANDMILALPDGYATRLGQGGCYLSAGQRRRLNLARACCGSPNLIVLDEPSSHLDEAGERSLHRAISDLLLHDSIVCIVTNKAALIQRSDLIVAFNARGETCISHPDEVLNPNIRALPAQQRRLTSVQ